MDDKKQTVWECKIGLIGDSSLPSGADAPMREAVRNAFGEMFAVEPEFIFSGWGSKLTESELAVVEKRLPSHAAEAKSYEELLAERNALQEALRESAAALQAIIKAGTRANEAGEIVMDGKTITIREILDKSDAVLAL